MVRLPDKPLCVFGLLSPLGARAPAGESTPLPHSPQAILGIGSLILRRHDEQLIARLDPFPTIWIKGPITSDDQGHHSVFGKPKLGYFNTDEPRLVRDAYLQQIGRDLVQRRHLDLNVVCCLIVNQSEQSGNEGQRRTL